MNRLLKSMKLKLILALTISLLAFQSAFALGTYAEGRAIVRLVKLESQGIIWNSYEGEFEIATYDGSQSCADPEDCYTPRKETRKFSIRESNQDVVAFMKSNMDRVMIIDYRIHRIEPVSLKTSFEVLGARAMIADHPEDFKRKLVVDRTGSQRNFSIYGKVLKLEYRGNLVGTYEALVYDRKKDRIRPVSITNEKMAAHIRQAMNAGKEYYLGISQAYATGFRESDLDIYEINYFEPAGI